jgi:hypothetical protein
MLHPKASPAERRAARARARSIYESIQPDLDARLEGAIVAIEVESGEHFVGPTIGEAAATARARHPGKPLHFFRVGFPSVYVWR